MAEKIYPRVEIRTARGKVLKVYVNQEDVVSMVSITKDDISLYLEKGNKYKIIPDNPLKKKHRNRSCILVEFPLYQNINFDTKAKVRFLDNNRIGKAEMEELVPLK